ncbi:hypothetical protein ACJMK2_003178 [Sinanodonta woodiana]|uniref:Uncharacterized protein n=1 Tax=Sinanodonta woodiana TaxID=1069815 RepID=A0ABD3XY40_SINWO
MGEPLPGDEPFKIFDIDYYNQLFLDSAGAIQSTYRAKDEGQEVYLQQSAVPKILVLKVGTLCNFSSEHIKWFAQRHTRSSSCSSRKLSSSYLFCWEICSVALDQL